MNESLKGSKAPVKFLMLHNNAKIHGVVTSLLPMKESKTCSYFNKDLTDDKGRMHMFGF